MALSLEKKLELLALLEMKEQSIKFNKLSTMYPEDGPLSYDKYKKHIEFFEAGKDHKFRLMQAANRVGKTTCAAFEVSCHVTGIYPSWWKGKRYKHPNNWWIGGVSASLIQSLLQPELLGPIGEIGTGMIPKHCLDLDSMKDAKKAETGITSFKIKHISGGISSIEFKSYESGRKAFQSTALNIWLDEEAPMSVYTECLLRTADTSKNNTDGYSLIMTFTPLSGITETILNFLDGQTHHNGPLGNGKYVVSCTWDDVPHLSEQDKALLLASIPPWQRDARTRGIPQLGAGAIYPIPISEITVKRFEIPKHWKRYAGMDVGSKTAAIWFATNPDTGVDYAYHEYYREGALPSVHVQSIILPGKYIPISIDHAAHGRSQIDGENLFDIYKELGLDLRNANKAVESGLYTVWEMLTTGRLKIFDDLTYFIKEYNLYRKDEQGRVVKKDDHIMDATRYGVMGRDLAKNEAECMSKPYVPMGVSNHLKGKSWR